MLRSLVLRATLTLLLLVALPIVAGAQEVTPSVTVSDQEIEDGTVTIDSVVAAGPGWIVIHADEDGSPGPDIGEAAVEEGENEDVEVEIDEEMATDTLYAMLHDDLGTEGTYEFPGADVPVEVDGQVVVESFQVQAVQETPTAEETPEATPEATPETTPEATPEATPEEPGVLPETGGFTPWAMMLVAAGAVALFSGLALASVRRPR